MKDTRLAIPNQPSIVQPPSCLCPCDAPFMSPAALYQLANRRVTLSLARVIMIRLLTNSNRCALHLVYQLRNAVYGRLLNLGTAARCVNQTVVPSCMRLDADGDSIGQSALAAISRPRFRVH